MRQFLIGYGSLIHASERARHSIFAEVRDVLVFGYQRGWIVKATNHKSYLGIRPVESHWFNGVLIPITDAQLADIDRRELAYERERVSSSRLSATVSGDDQAWIYLPKPELTSSAYGPGHPVRRSHVDLVMEGVLARGEEFAGRFVATTLFWEQYWIDDRDAKPEVQARVDGLVAKYYAPLFEVPPYRLDASPAP